MSEYTEKLGQYCKKIDNELNLSKNDMGFVLVIIRNNEEGVGIDAGSNMELDDITGTLKTVLSKYRNSYH